MISLQNISVTFGEKKVLNNFSLDLRQNGIICFSGPSGSGKTTLLRVIAKLCPVQSGKIKSDYINPAFMFQEDRLLPWLTASQNISAVLSGEASDSSLNWLDKVGLLKEKDTFPSELSGGMRRRVAFARALAYCGDILLLDEPFKGLDRELVEDMCSIIKAQNMPALIITHSPDEIGLLGGRVIYFDGPPLTVKN